MVVINEKSAIDPAALTSKIQSRDLGSQLMFNSCFFPQENEKSVTHLLRFKTSQDKEMQPGDFRSHFCPHVMLQ